MSDQQGTPSLPGTNRVPPLDDAHADGLLMHELTVVNTLLGRYVLHFLDADAGRTDAISTSDERALADQVSAVAAGIRDRANRRDHHGEPPPLTTHADNAGSLD